MREQFRDLIGEMWAFIDFQCEGLVVKNAHLHRDVERLAQELANEEFQVIRALHAVVRGGDWGGWLYLRPEAKRCSNKFAILTAVSNAVNLEERKRQERKRQERGEAMEEKQGNVDVMRTALTNLQNWPIADDYEEAVGAKFVFEALCEKYDGPGQNGLIGQVAA